MKASDLALSVSMFPAVCLDSKLLVSCSCDLHTWNAIVIELCTVCSLIRPPPSYWDVLPGSIGHLLDQLCVLLWSRSCLAANKLHQRGVRCAV